VQAASTAGSGSIGRRPVYPIVTKAAETASTIAASLPAQPIAARRINVSPMNDKARRWTLPARAEPLRSSSSP